MFLGYFLIRLTGFKDAGMLFLITTTIHVTTGMFFCFYRQCTIFRTQPQKNRLSCLFGHKI